MVLRFLVLNSWSVRSKDFDVGKQCGKYNIKYQGIYWPLEIDGCWEGTNICVWFITNVCHMVYHSI